MTDGGCGSVRRKLVTRVARTWSARMNILLMMVKANILRVDYFAMGD